MMDNGGYKYSTVEDQNYQTTPVIKGETLELNAPDLSVDNKVWHIVKDEIHKILKEEFIEFESKLLKELEKPLDIKDVEEMVHMIKEVKAKDDDQARDDYHTMQELYDHRTVLFALICSKLYPELAWKSEKHSDGTSEPGWFIAGLETPFGQITYHQKSKYWGIFDCKVLDKAPEYDGHTPGHVLTRLSFLISHKI